MLPPELTNSIEQFIVYVHRNEAYFTYIYVYIIIPMFLRLTACTNTLPQMSFCLLFFFALLTAGVLIEPQLPATTSNMWATDVSLGGVGRVPPPKQKAWLCRCIALRQQYATTRTCSGFLDRGTTRSGRLVIYRNSNHLMVSEVFLKFTHSVDRKPCYLLMHVMYSLHAVATGIRDTARR